MKSVRKSIVSFLLFGLVLAAGLSAAVMQTKADTKKVAVRVTTKGKKTEQTLQVGDTVQLVVRSGKKELESGQATFASSKKKVVSVTKGGLMTAKKAGTAVIKIRYKKKMAKIKVTVTDPAAADTGGKTIRQYLYNALEPVGQVLYVWGGGWYDANKKGITSAMKKWYSSQSYNYNYHSCDDLSATSRAKGFDCSGFVGWAAYQVMHKKTGEAAGYTDVSGRVGGNYKSMGWGSIISQSKLASKGYVLKAGDIGFNAGHVFIVLGQCKDKSIVVLHSTTQAGVQIGGTATPDGNYSSQAITLATKYMKKYYAASMKKYPYQLCAGNMITQYDYFRWNRSTLADPEGYMDKTADEILADLFKGK